MPKREAKKSRAQEDREKEEKEEAEAAAAKGKKKEPEPDSDEEEPAKPAPAVFDPPDRAPAKAAGEGDDEDGSEDESEDEDEDEDEAPKAAEAEPGPPVITLPASMATCYKEILQGAGFKGHEEYPDITDATEVFYCPVCGLPPDFCIWGPSWDKCKPVAMEKFPYYYPDLAGGDLGDAKDKAKAADDKSKLKELPGGKKTRAKSPEIIIRKMTRGGRKCVTSIQGLEGFGVKPEAAAKIMKKKFACGCAPVKGEQGQPDTVDIQGDFEDEVIQLLVENFKEIPKKKISVAEGGKVKGRK